MAKKKRKGKKRGPKRRHSMHKAGFAGPLRKRGRPRKKVYGGFGSAAKKKTSKKKKKSKSRGGKLPEKVIRKFAHTLKKNKRAADIYRDVLGC